jgi:hypothetical protein
LCAQALQAQQPTQPPEPVDSNPINGEVYFFINQLSGLQMDLDADSSSPGSAILQNTRTFIDLSQRWATAKMPDGNWKIVNTRSGLCLDSTGGSSPTTVENPCGINVITQEWSFTYAGSYAAYKNTGNGYNAITNAGTGKLLSVSGGSTSSGADLVQTALSTTPTGTQLWLFRPAFWRGDDITSMEKAEYDRASTNTCASSGTQNGSDSCNNQDLPWWHDAYLPGQDILQIFKNAGLNEIRIQPAGVVETLIHGSVTFDQTTGPYNGYTVGSGTSTTFPLTSTTQLIPTSASTTGEVVALSDWGGVDSAARAKQLGMAVYVDLFSDGVHFGVPGLWAAGNYPVTDLVGTPENEHPPSNSSGGTYDCSGKNLVYNYVKQEMEMYRANGAFPDLFAAGDEIQGFFSLDGTSYAPSSFSASAFQNAAFQGAFDAASDTSNPSLLGNPIAPPLRCEDLGGGHDLQEELYSDTVTYGMKLDLVCQSYYPSNNEPLTQAQYNWKSGGDIEETNILAETDLGVTGVVAPGTTKEAHPALGYPVYFPETAVAYTNSGGENPLDYWYGSLLSPSVASRTKERQYYIDIETVQENNPDHLGFGIECWSCESTGVSVNPAGNASATAGALHQYDTDAQLGLFDNSSSTTAGTLPDAAAGTKPVDNATLPAMMGLGGRTDPAYNYMLVNANGGILETALASQSSGAALDVAVYNGIVSEHQQWKILAQGGDAELNNATYPTPMDHLGDGYFQIVNQNQADGVFVLDNDAATMSNSAAVQYAETVVPTAISGTNGNQEWDIMTVGNCGDIPANCTNPPLTALGDYYVIVNKKNGLLLALNGSSIVQQSPAAASNGDWIVPSAKGQLWQIVPVRIGAPSTPAVLAFASAPPTSVATGGNLGTIKVNVENTAQALIGTPSKSVTLAITGPQDYNDTVSSSAAVASFNLSGDTFNTAGTYTITATSSGLTSASASFEVVSCTPTAIVPYISVNGGSAWTEESSATVSSTTTAVDIGPQPVSGGSWSWTGPNNYTSTSRQINSIPLTVGTDSFVATYTNSSGCKSTETFTISVL